MQKGFLIQGLVLLSVPLARRPKTRVAVTRRTKRFCFCFQQKVFWFCVWLVSFTALTPPQPLFSRRTADRSLGLPRVGATVLPACVPPPQSPASSQSRHRVQPETKPHSLSGDCLPKSPKIGFEHCLQELAQITIAGFADTQLPIALSRLILSRPQSQVRAHIAARGKPLRVRQRQHIRQPGQYPTPGTEHNTLVSPGHRWPAISPRIAS